MSREDRFAPNGFLWVCGACGKWAKDRYGMEGERSYGWDESCMLNSALYAEDRLVRNTSGRVTEVRASRDSKGEG